MVKFFSQITNNPQQTKNLGFKLARKFLKRKKIKKALVLGLKGDLGGGKTTFLQGFARGLGIKEKVLSPTFLIIKKYKLDNWTTGQLDNLYHFDCYRIQKPKDVLDLSFKKIISDSKNIIAIEWADKIKKIMPKDTIWLNFEFLDNKKRKIDIKNQP
jgi:tRNA threonylcarbamoyladenosine biosynthesis protein TsaE